MQIRSLLLKYYGLSIFITGILAVFKPSSPWLATLASLFILSGLVYHFIKDNFDTVSDSDMYKIVAGVSLPSVILTLVFSSRLGFGHLPLGSALGYGLVFTVVNAVAVYGFAVMSKGIIESAPAEGEND
ncbi:hypothetical protein [Pseudomonas sp. GV071]|jgi:hypothetical protein|uniref:hypothetical protein n=1 Tax=Pseudomonas sp. GV071 TaxID=2135754 RepID=UPI000D3B9CBB|nr:hypothetical protein [Pseudomonas sp. GV071]PTQ73187.1 hypothetical protein C8K61_102397 [Pseudomonas sp. GV071]